MSSSEPNGRDEIQVDADNLYREESFTDLKVASIRRLVPVKADGSPDESREAMFVGQTHVMSTVGPVPVQCPLEAKTLQEAMQQFPDAVKQAVATMVEEAKELRRQEASRIVVPQPGVGPGPGKIQLS